MTPEQDQRFQMLQSGPCTPADYVHGYYGLTWPLSGPATAAFGQYTTTLRRRPSCPQGRMSRYDLEGFMAWANVSTKKWMAVRVGMSEPSLEDLLAKLDALGMQRVRYEIGSEFVADSLSDDLARYVPALRFLTFGDHIAYCERLHAELAKTLGLTVQRLFCATSDRLQEYPRQFAAYFDCLTLEPLSVRHSMSLNFPKPLYLPPDRCSKLFYLENHEVLKRFIAGSSEPEDLGEYEQFLASGQHG